MNRLAVCVLYALMLAGLLMLTGCASAPALSTATAVPVPVQCPAPVLPPKPRLPIEELKPASTPEEAVAAYSESLNICVSRVRALEQLFKGYQP